MPEEVELQLDRVDCLEPLQEGGERPRLRRLVDDPEQVRGHRHVAEAEQVDLGAEVLRNGLEPRLQPLRTQVERVVVVAVGDGADAHQHLGRLGDLDLDRDRRGPGEVEHGRAPVLFDSHGTDPAYSQRERLDKVGCSITFEQIKHVERLGAADVSRTAFLSQVTHDRQQDRLAAAAVHRLVRRARPATPSCAHPPAHRGRLDVATASPYEAGAKALH